MIFQYIQINFDAVEGNRLGFKQSIQIGPLLKNALIVTIIRAGYNAKESINGGEGISHILLLK